MQGEYSHMLRSVYMVLAASAWAFAHPSSAAPITFNDIVSSGEAALQYQSAPSINAPLLTELQQIETIFLDVHLGFAPTKAGGSPGIAVFDYDNDGDSDLYVTNANHERTNSLFVNQYRESGQVTFIDQGMEAGVGLGDVTSHLESTGTCFGDIDNDGDDDLYVTGLGENVLLENSGNGSFTNITVTSGTGGGGHSASACSFGDVNNDGLLDLVVANTYDNWQHRLPLLSFDFAALIEPNQLFVNTGDNQFVEQGEVAGIQNVNGITWAVALVDIDQDGDVDLLTADDQGPKPDAAFGGFDQGQLRIYTNDGSGQFTDYTNLSGIGHHVAGWMGLAVGDLNHDGHLDIFGSDTGDHVGILSGQMGGFLSIRSSRWFYGNGDGTFTYPGIGDLGTSPFGWGAVILDYDNDSDNDIIFHGGLDFGTFVDASNPGAVLNNDGRGNFTRDTGALANSVDHIRRNVQSLASADLNQDGFADMITASNMDWPEPFPLVPYAAVGLDLPGQFSDSALIWFTYTPLGGTDFSAGFAWNQMEPVDGSLAIELSSADNGNQWLQVKARGSVGDLNDARVNRNGIGAVIKVTPAGGASSVLPVISGATHNSASELMLGFGLGAADEATVEVHWPGGVRNRLYHVNAGERLVFPEIPCDFSDTNQSIASYMRCVSRSLRQLNQQGAIDHRLRQRLQWSAFFAHLEERFYR